jgi:hypothetical protein
MGDMVGDIGVIRWRDMLVDAAREIWTVGMASCAQEAREVTMFMSVEGLATD